MPNSCSTTTHRETGCKQAHTARTHSASDIMLHSQDNEPQGTVLTLAAHLTSHPAQRDSATPASPSARPLPHAPASCAARRASQRCSSARDTTMRPGLLPPRHGPPAGRTSRAPSRSDHASLAAAVAVSTSLAAPSPHRCSASMRASTAPGPSRVEGATRGATACAAAAGRPRRDPAGGPGRRAPPRPPGPAGTERAAGPAARRRPAEPRPPAAHAARPRAAAAPPRAAPGRRPHCACRHLGRTAQARHASHLHGHDFRPSQYPAGCVSVT